MQSLVDQLETLPEWLDSQSQPAFRARQIRKWVLQKRAIDFAAMTDLPQPLRERLAETFTVLPLEIARHQQSPDGTEKLLVKLSDGNHVECVLLRDGARRTICVSSQVGCAMGCVFCASGLDGVERNLTNGEILAQMLLLQRLLPADERLSHIVMMGMGEPLANLNQVLGALEVATSAEGLGISPRRITISTVGLPPAIDRLAKLNCRFNLAISLHAPNDALRNQLVPVNDRVGIADLLDAAERYFQVSGRRLTFEYVLLAGVNDSVVQAVELANLLKGRCQLLNVIPYNPVAGLPYETPSPQAIAAFRETLMREGIEIKFRQRKGDKINAACGQLRRIANQSPQRHSLDGDAKGSTL
ncbi:MAG: 23S rRNA (adenine(2503)-C(2))-methyltransferase RlmN [Pirellulaceae bacterium]|nr:23S rRNA (adenine(2503)-C(2))-methyltransferase RlmN [Pirellulaceae bacterium]MDG2102264.1 23S rRNA (adenine(2503)-C(2))-methyltransferase RlmN [Pirellulaceae bacterium]